MIMKKAYIVGLIIWMIMLSARLIINKVSIDEGLFKEICLLVCYGN
jgi:hypothetical protein